ncbi:ATP-binding protein [Aestuariispira insulae]|uniref:Histidine kinase-like protein n=1 Tax=Aestuariispira insulae TaxID=1461337 RepID=A0A3D9HXY0_9PROT|nr:ATP-binding protein [Aestuariispira insulae]RED54269.1 histidine kinase-like protein [Aestuariispira insulae]
MLRTILLVLEDTAARERLNKLITEWGYFVIPVFVPGELPTFIEKCNPDAVLANGFLVNKEPDCLARLTRLWERQNLKADFIYLEGHQCAPAYPPNNLPPFFTGRAFIDDDKSLLRALSEVFSLAPLPKRRTGAELTQIFRMLQTPDGENFLDFDLEQDVTEGLERVGKLIENPTDRLNEQDQAEFKVQTLSEAENVASAIANVCPDPVMAGLGLRELMINAIEHGNLGISHAEKAQLVREATWEQEIKRRLGLAENREKYVQVEFERRNDRIIVEIRDQGKGFDWRIYMDSVMNPSLKPHGRGISIATLIAFDSVEYKGRGNEVQVMIKC